MPPNSDYRVAAIRASTVLTGSYVAGTLLRDDISKYNQLVVLVDITLGSLTSAEVRVEFSLDNVRWFQKPFQLVISSTQASVSSGEYTFTVDGLYPMDFPIAYNFIRISAKGTGTVTNSLMQVDAILARV